MANKIFINPLINGKYIFDNPETLLGPPLPPPFPSIGPLKASELVLKFSGAEPFILSEYHSGGLYVPANVSGDNGPIPTSGVLKFSDFLGAPVATP